MAGPSHDPSLYRDRDSGARAARPRLGERQDRPARARRGARRRGRRDRVDRLAGRPHPRCRLRGDGCRRRVTGFPESLDGRVKTLHPSVHAGLLADLRLEDHERQLAELDIAPFELVVVNLYPFVETVASGAEGDDVVEQIDIGGPAMVRASAKNFANVAIVVSPESYPAVIESHRARAARRSPQRRELAARAFAHTAAYDRAVAAWFSEETPRRRGQPAGSPHDQGRAARDAALRRELAPARRDLHASGRPRHRAGDAAAGQGDVVQQLRRCGCRPARRVRHGASPPSRSSSTRTPAASRSRRRTPSTRSRARTCARTSATPCRRSAASSRPTAPSRSRWPRTCKDIFTEVIVAPDFEPEALEVFTLEEEPARCCSCPPTGSRSARTSAWSRAACCCRMPTASPTTSSRSRRTGSSSRASAGRGRGR